MRDSLKVQNRFLKLFLGSANVFRTWKLVQEMGTQQRAIRLLVVLECLWSRKTSIQGIWWRVRGKFSANSTFWEGPILISRRVSTSDFSNLTIMSVVYQYYLCGSKYSWSHARSTPHPHPWASRNQKSETYQSVSLPLAFTLTLTLSQPEIRNQKPTNQSASPSRLHPQPLTRPTRNQKSTI